MYVILPQQYPIDQSNYYGGSSYMMPQYTQTQLNDYYQQYGQYPPGYQPQPQQQSYGIAATAYAQPTGIAYGQHQTTTSPSYGQQAGYLATDPRLAR